MMGYLSKLVLIRQLRSLFAGRQLLQNTSWMLAAEGVSRVSRLATIFVLGLLLTPAEYGTMMLAIICHETIRVFSRVGCGAKVVQCADYELDALASNAGTLQWMLCILVAGAQIAVADVIASYYNNPQLGQLLSLMALSHLVYPMVAVRVFLTQRENNMRLYARVSAISISTENLVTALAVVFGMGPYAIVVAKLFSAFGWMALFYRASTARYPLAFSLAHMRQLTAYSGKVLSSELLKTGRLQLDSFIAARLLGVYEFGLYSFAKSAGIGLSQSISAGFLSSLYPHLCDKFRAGRLRPSIRHAYLIGAAISVLFLVQAALAPVYIKLIFDDRWASISVAVSILCLSAAPSLMLDISATVYRAKNLIGSEVSVMLAGLASLALPLLWLQPQSALAFATTVAAASLLWLLVSLIPLRDVLRFTSPKPEPTGVLRVS